MSDMQKVLKELQEAAAVTAAIQGRHAQRIVDHEQWLEEHTAAITQHREWIQQHEAVMQQLDAKLERLTDLILKGRGGNGG